MRSHSGSCRSSGWGPPVSRNCVDPSPPRKSICFGSSLSMVSWSLTLAIRKSLYWRAQSSFHLISRTSDTEQTLVGVLGSLSLQLVLGGAWTLGWKVSQGNPSQSSSSLSFWGSFLRACLSELLGLVVSASWVVAFVLCMRLSFLALISSTPSQLLCRKFASLNFRIGSFMLSCFPYGFNPQIQFVSFNDRGR
jgi:hypothetical protein